MALERGMKRGCSSPHCPRDSSGVTVGPESSCSSSRGALGACQEDFTLSRSHTENPREQKGCSGLCSSLRKLPLLQPPVIPRASTSRVLNIPTAEVFNFKKETTSKVRSCFYEETERGNKNLWEALSLFRETHWDIRTDMKCLAGGNCKGKREESKA